MMKFEDFLPFEETVFAPLTMAMEEVRAALPGVEDIGRSAGDRNVYGLIDRLSGAMVESFPGSLCGPGCGDCCSLHRALIRIYRSEWEPVYDHLLATREPAELDALRTHFWENFGPYMNLLAELQGELDAGRRPAITREQLPLRCPLLVEESCSVYPVRPAICRAYGHFGLEQPGREGQIFACGMQQKAVEAQLEAEGLSLRLPDFRPLYQKVADLCEEEPKRLIPLWFADSFPRR